MHLFSINRKNISLIIIASSFIYNAAFSQRDLTPSKRNQAFGTRDFRDLRNYGMQISVGPTYMLTNPKNEIFHGPDTAIRPFDYFFDPKGLIGVFAEVGMAHYPTKDPKPFKKIRLISYYDWGVGFKYFGGTEQTTIQNLSQDGSIINELVGKGEFHNGYAYGRFTAHHNFHINKQFFIDNGLGINFDYRVMSGNKNYQGTVLPTTQYFHNSIVAQMHYDIGFGIRLKRGSYLIPGAQIPILGFYEWNKGNASLRWYSSKYRPILFKIKYIWLLEKKKKKNGCSQGSPDDKKRNDEYMQGN